MLPRPVLTLSVKLLADAAETVAARSAVAEPTALVEVMTTDLGAAPYALLKLKTVSQVVGDPVPTVMTNDPAVSVEPAVTTAVGVTPQLLGVPIVGALV